MSAKQAITRNELNVFIPITTRWMDNDAYGHINNVTYYSFFDTAVNQHLIDIGMLNVDNSDVIGLVVETGCTYFSSLAFPDELEVGFRVSHLGTSSVRYELGVFQRSHATAAAQGHFVHVYVDRTTRRPVSIPAKLREKLAQLA